MIWFSPSFKFAEFVYSRTAIKQNIKNKPTIEHIVNGAAHSNLILQPFRDDVNEAVIVTSWYRCPELNTAVGGSVNSTHTAGSTTDIVVRSMTTPEVIDRIIFLKLPYQKIIDEGFYNDKGEWVSWTHVESPTDRRKKPAREHFIARGDRRNPTYERVA